MLSQLSDDLAHGVHWRIHHRQGCIGGCSGKTERLACDFNNRAGAVEKGEVKGLGQEGAPGIDLRAVV